MINTTFLNKQSFDKIIIVNENNTELNLEDYLSVLRNKEKTVQTNFQFFKEMITIINVSSENSNSQALSSELVTGEIILLEEFLNPAIVLMTLLQSKQSHSFIIYYDKSFNEIQNPREKLYEHFLSIEENLNDMKDGLEFTIYENKKLIELYAELVPDTNVSELIKVIRGELITKPQLIICQDSLLFTSIKELISEVLNRSQKIIEIENDNKIPDVVGKSNFYIVKSENNLQYLYKYFLKENHFKEDGSNIIFFIGAEIIDQAKYDRFQTTRIKTYKELEKYYSNFLEYFILSANKTLDDNKSKLINLLRSIGKNPSLFEILNIYDNFSELLEYAQVLDFREIEIYSERELLTYLMEEIENNKHIYIKTNFIWKDKKEIVIRFKGTEYRTKATVKGLLLEFIIQHSDEKFFKSSDFLNKLDIHLETGYGRTFETVDDNFQNLVEEFKKIEKKAKIQNNRFSDYLIQNVHFDITKNGGVQIEIDRNQWQFHDPNPS